MKAKQGYEAPDELIAETAFGPIEGFFILSFIIIGILTGGSLFVGFYYSLLFFKIIGFLFLGILIVDIIIFNFVKNIFTKISQNVTKSVREYTTTPSGSTIDIEVTETISTQK